MQAEEKIASMLNKDDALQLLPSGLASFVVAPFILHADPRFCDASFCFEFQKPILRSTALLSTMPLLFRAYAGAGGLRFVVTSERFQPHLDFLSSHKFLFPPS